MMFPPLFRLQTPPMMLLCAGMCVPSSNAQRSKIDSLLLPQRNESSLSYLKLEIKGDVLMVNAGSSSLIMI